ncbi:MAG: hypothetical protein AAF724_02125 [Pseudomonadota bacterium]
MKKLTLPAAVMALALAASPAALAAQSQSASQNQSNVIGGAYILLQKDDRQRVLSLESGGTVTQVSDLENETGFTSGLGAWTRTGADSARASVVDFNHETDGNNGPGASKIVYDLTFSDPVDGIYQTVTGYYAGQAFQSGQNPLSNEEPHVRSFGTRFEGKRIVAE